jgi:hypothetical protein
MTISNTPNFTNPIGIAPVPNIPLCFISAATPVFSNNSITIFQALTQQNQSTILYANGAGVAPWNSTWMLSPDGMITCPLWPQYVLGVISSNDTSYLVICEKLSDGSDPTQYWTITGSPGAYTIANNSTPGVITAPDSQGVYGPDTWDQPILTVSPIINGKASPGQLWVIQTEVQQPPNNQFYIQTGLSGAVNTGANPYMLTASSGEEAVITQWQPGDSSQLWIFNADGTVASAANPGLVLTSNSNNGQVSLVASSGLPAQQWTYISNDISIVSVVFGGSLSVDMGGSIGTVYLNLSGGSLSPNTHVITWGTKEEANNAWFTFPALNMSVGEWFYLQTEVTGGNGSDVPFVLTVVGTVANPTIEIQYQQPNALNQLWQVNADGVMISALDRSLALTANSSNQGVTIQTKQTPDQLQQWYRQSNGMLAVGTTTTNVSYLMVGDETTNVAGTAVVTGSFTSNPSSSYIWNTVPYIPEPSGLWFTIQTALAAPGAQTPYLLTADDEWNIELMPPLGGYVLPQGQAALNQLWRKTLNGNIVSAFNPNLVLTGPAAGKGATLAPLQPGSTNQQWFWGYSQELAAEGTDYVLCGILQNSGQGQVLWAASAAPGEVTLQAAAAVNDTASQLWYMLPSGPAFEQSTPIRNIGGVDEVAGLFLSLPASSTTGTFEAVVNEQSGNPALSMWQFSYSGYIVSAINPDIVLSLESAGSGSNPQIPVYTNNVVAYPRQPGMQPFQLWTATANGIIVNQYNGQALTISATTTPSGVTTTALSSDPKTDLQLWDFSPGVALQTTLEQPPVSYPAWTTGQAAAYKVINDELGLPDGIRGQYANLAAPLSNYQLQMNLILLPLINDAALTSKTKPTLAELEDWISVVTQLNKEITAVTAIQLLFQQVTALHLSLSQAQAMTLSELITGCMLPDGLQTKIPPKKKKKRGWIADLIEGITYTAFNVAGIFFDDPKAGEQMKMGVKFVKNGLPCIANLMSTGLSTYQGVRQTKSQTKSNAEMAKYETAFNTAMQNAYNYEMTVLELQQSLLSEFEAIGSALGQIEALILSDWGKLQVVYDMTRSAGSISSLYWPSTMTPIQANQMLSGYTVGVLQTLMPENTNFKINATMHINNQDLSEGWQSDGSFVENNENATQNIFSTTVNQQIMDTVWANGVDPISFFRCMNGWSLPVIYQNTMGPASPNSSDLAAGVIVTIQNLMYQELNLTLSVISLLGTGSNFDSLNLGSRSTIIPPYGVLEFAGACWQDWDYSDNAYMPTALLSGNGGLEVGVAIAAAGSNILTSTVTNSYAENQSVSASIPATYIWAPVSSPGYSCNLTQNFQYNQGPSPTSTEIVLVNITISATS